MKSGKSFLRQVDEVAFKSTASKLVEDIKGVTSAEDVQRIIMSGTVVDPYKQAALVEYLDKNKDKLLSLATYTEGQPVVISDEYAPLAGKHGKVVSRGAEFGTIKVKFEDGEYDVPEHHITRKDAIATESKVDSKVDALKEHRCFALFTDGTLAKVILESFVDAESLISEQLNKDVLAVFPELVSDSFIAEAKKCVDEEMTPEQKAKREEIVMGLKKNADELKKRYGDRWEGVMYAIATKKAMEESLAEASEDVLFKQKSGSSTVMIVKDGEYFRAKKIDHMGNVTDVQEFSDFKSAEQAAQIML
jgi:hypothetical protein